MHWHCIPFCNQSAKLLFFKIYLLVIENHIFCIKLLVLPIFVLVVSWFWTSARWVVSAFHCSNGRRPSPFALTRRPKRWYWRRDAAIMTPTFATSWMAPWTLWVWCQKEAFCQMIWNAHNFEGGHIIAFVLLWYFVCVLFFFVCLVHHGIWYMVHQLVSRLMLQDLRPRTCQDGDAASIGRKLRFVVVTKCSRQHR